MVAATSKNPITTSPLLRQKIALSLWVECQWNRGANPKRV